VICHGLSRGRRIVKLRRFGRKGQSSGDLDLILSSVAAWRLFAVRIGAMAATALAA
jgi:hypothetical protein